MLPWEFQHHPLQLNLHLLPHLSHLHNNLHHQYQYLPLQHPHQWLMFSLLQHQLQLYHALHSLHVKANDHPYLLLALLIFLGTKFHLVTTCLCLINSPDYRFLLGLDVLRPLAFCMSTDTLTLTNPKSGVTADFPFETSSLFSMEVDDSISVLTVLPHLAP